MLSHRTTARAVLFLLVLGILAGTAHAASPKRIVFPIIASKSWFTDDFGAPRPQGSHEGNDIMAPRKAPVVAAESGHVRLWTQSARAGCMLYLYGDSGTSYIYVHLNNDVSRKNDNRGGCAEGVAYAPGLIDGQHVEAGELLGYVGDSGDADGIHPHVHFELHEGGQGPVSPFQKLRRARRILFPLPPSSAEAPDGNPPLMLALYGRVKAAGDGSLTVRVRRVRMSNGWRHRVRKKVVLSVPAEATLERTVQGKRESTGLDQVAANQRVVVWTTELEHTLETQLAQPRALTAARVLFRGETRKLQLRRTPAR